tara:strand:- start:3568 stop:3810 length:243 start_codon:yes stop_codon:yes gene_type:complete
MAEIKYIHVNMAGVSSFNTKSWKGAKGGTFKGGKKDVVSEKRPTKSDPKPGSGPVNQKPGAGPVNEVPKDKKKQEEKKKP